MKGNNENETYTLHFMFSYKYSTYQIFMDTCNENNIKITYQIMGDKKHDTPTRLVGSCINNSFLIILLMQKQNLILR